MIDRIKIFFKKHWKGVAILLCAAMLILWNVHLFNQGNINKKKVEVAEHNLEVAKDSIRIIQDRAGRDEYNKLAYLTNSVQNLAKLNQSLANEVRQIKGNVTTIIQGQVRIIHDTVPMIVHGRLLDSTVFTMFRFDTVYSPGNFRRLTGHTKFDLRTGSAEGIKELDEFGVKFTTGIKNLDKGKPEIFLKSDYPNFQVTALEGAELDPKLFHPAKKVPLITPNIIVGWTPVTYKSGVIGLNGGQFSAGVGIGFNLFKVLGIKK